MVLKSNHKSSWMHHTDMNGFSDKFHWNETTGTLTSVGFLDFLFPQNISKGPCAIKGPFSGRARARRAARQLQNTSKFCFYNARKYMEIRR